MPHSEQRAWRDVRSASTDQRPGGYRRDAPTDVYEEFFEALEAKDAAAVEWLMTPDTTLLESRVEYTRLDGSKVTIPAATAIVRRDGLVAAQRVYVDVAPLAS